MNGIAGRVFLLTGAAQGIAWAAAQRLVALGGIVALTDVDAAAAASAAEKLRATGGTVRSFAWDVRVHARAAAVVAEVEDSLGPVYGLLASAGVVNSGRSETLAPERWTGGLDINLSGTFYSCQAAGAAMLRHGAGAIVTMSSVTGLQGQPGRALYSATKWGIIGLTKTLALEWGHRGIRVNAVSPNAVDTPLAHASIVGGFLDEVILDRTPLARTARPDEIAEAIVFLLSDGASYINGVVLPVDGGLTAGYMTHKHGHDTGSRDVQRAGG